MRRGAALQARPRRPGGLQLPSAAAAGAPGAAAAEEGRAAFHASEWRAPRSGRHLPAPRCEQARPLRAVPAPVSPSEPPNSAAGASRGPVRARARARVTSRRARAGAPGAACARRGPGGRERELSSTRGPSRPRMLSGTRPSRTARSTSAQSTYPKRRLSSAAILSPSASSKPSTPQARTAPRAAWTSPRAVPAVRFTMEMSGAMRCCWPCPARGRCYIAARDEVACQVLQPVVLRHLPFRIQILLVQRALQIDPGAPRHGRHGVDVAAMAQGARGAFRLGWHAFGAQGAAREGGGVSLGWGGAGWEILVCRAQPGWRAAALWGRVARPGGTPGRRRGAGGGRVAPGRAGMRPHRALPRALGWLLRGG